MNSWLKRKVAKWLGLDNVWLHIECVTKNISAMSAKLNRAEVDLMLSARVMGQIEAEIAKLQPKRDPNTGRFIKG